MATYAQRITAIANAVVNGPATAPQMDSLGAALAGRAGRSAEYAAALPLDRARIAVEEIRILLLDVVRQHETAAATSAVASNVSALFVEAPN